MHAFPKCLLLATTVLLLIPPGVRAQRADQQPAPTINEFILYAERSIKLAEHNEFESGSIGVRTPLVLKGSSQLIIGKHNETRDLYSPSVKIENDASTHAIATNSLDRDPDSHIGPQSSFPKGMPALPLATASGSGENIFVKEHEERMLSPGVYGELRMAPHSKVTLQSGRYVFASVKMDEDCKLWGERSKESDRTPAKGVEVHVIGGLWMDERAEIETHADDPKAHEFTIKVAGADPGVSTNDDGLGPRNVVTIGEEAKVHALLAAPHGTVRMYHEASIHGAIAAFDIVTDEKAHGAFEDGFPVNPPGQSGSQQLSGYFGAPPDPSIAPIAGPTPPNTVVYLSIGLPIQNPAGLQTLIGQASDPTSHNFRHYLTQAEFNATYGAPAADYATLVNWAQSQGLIVVKQYPNNLLLDVSGSAAQIEAALYTNLIYRLRKDGKQFVTADRDPSLDLNVNLLHISGLTDFITPKPNQGSAAGGGLAGFDFRNAYLGIGTPCSGLTGAGETIGLFELDSFNQSDIAQYDTTDGVATVQNTTPLSVITPAVNGSASLGSGQTEVTLDIQLAQSMAPGANIIVFEGSTGITGHGDSVLHAMATSSPPITIGSSSWTYGWNPNGEQAMAQMAAEGISYFQSSGDNGSIGDPTDNRDMMNQTIVGGTNLQTNALLATLPAVTNYPSPYYNGDATWPGSSGGFMNGGTEQCWPWPFCTSASTGIPGYQTGVSMATNGGSPTFRNFPDVAMDALFVPIVNGAPTSQVGTSEATPLWAGFTALANQASLAAGLGRAGFINPLIYAIGLTSNQPAPNLYSQTFNDVNDNVSTGTFNSVPGYDLTSGWGTPKCALITQIATPAPLNPATFNEIEIHVSNGDDGIRDDSVASVTVNFNGGIPPLSNNFHPSGASGWDDKGVVHNIILPLPQALPPSAIHDVTFTFTSTKCCIGDTCCDNWSIAGLDVRLFLPRADR